MSPHHIVFVSALVVLPLVVIAAIVFSGKLFRAEATLAIVLTVITVAGWVWRMPRGWYTISQIAFRYRLKTSQVCEVADQLGMRVVNRGGLVAPSQRKKMHPELMRLKKRRGVRERSTPNNTRLVYESSAAQPDFLVEADRLQFSREELLRHLRPSIAHFGADVEDEAV